MIFIPEPCSIPDQSMYPFIDPKELWDLINTPQQTSIDDIIKKAKDKQRLTLKEVAALIQADQPEQIAHIQQGARELKKNVYGNRMVLFAPLYVGNQCVNNCSYCGFRSSNKEAIRKTLTDQELILETEALEDQGQKRLILVYGEHPQYDAHYIAHTARVVYSVRRGAGEIRRVNINAAPLDIEGFKIVKEAGIGTYQIFQETYHPQAYAQYHLGGKKRDFEYRLTGLDRALEAGLDDVGIGALFGLYDWRYELLALVRHAIHLEACFGVGPHTVSFPRIQDFSTGSLDSQYRVLDEAFLRLIAILRLAIPYTGLILTARESATLRHQAIEFGVSQLDGGTKLEIGAYAQKNDEPQDLNKEQFMINDQRSLAEIVDDLIEKEYLPSFCTACYRKGRTGEHFMEFSVPGFIKRFCTPNAILTLSEYLIDYAKPDVAEKGWRLIEKELQAIEDLDTAKSIRDKIERLRQGQRDLYF